jgi:hypothetical protein
MTLPSFDDRLLFSRSPLPGEDFLPTAPWFQLTATPTVGSGQGVSPGLSIVVSFDVATVTVDFGINDKPFVARAVRNDESICRFQIVSAQRGERCPCGLTMCGPEPRDEGAADEGEPDLVSQMLKPAFVVPPSP